MAIRYILASVAAVCLLVILQMTGVLSLVQPTYRVWTLHRLEAGDVQSIPWALEYLDSKDLRLRGAAARGLGKIGQADKTVIAALIKRLDTDVPRVASESAWALGALRMREDDSDDSASQAEVTDALVRALSNKNSEVRRYAAYSLSQRAVGAEQASEALVACLTDQRMGYMAARALGDIGANESADEIAAQLEGAPWHFQEEAAVALSKLQPLPPEIQKQLDELIEKNSGVREAVSYSLSITSQPKQQQAGSR